MSFRGAWRAGTAGAAARGWHGVPGPIHGAGAGDWAMVAPVPSPSLGGSAASSPDEGGPCADAAPDLSPGGGALSHRPPARAGAARPPPDGAGEARDPLGGADVAPGYHGGTCTERFSLLNPTAALVTISPTHPSVLSVCKPPPAPATDQDLSLSLVWFRSSSPAR
jgi:hypothetical protein